MTGERRDDVAAKAEALSAEFVESVVDPTSADRAYWREKGRGMCANDRGGYYAAGFRHGYEVGAADERERIAQAIEADPAAWDALGTPAPGRESDAQWFVNRAMMNAARIARGGGDA